MLSKRKTDTRLGIRFPRYELAAAAVIVATAVVSCVSAAATAAAEEDEDKNDYPRAIVTTKVTHL